jgi:hypothetical protein
MMHWWLPEVSRIEKILCLPINPSANISLPKKHASRIAGSPPALPSGPLESTR